VLKGFGLVLLICALAPAAALANDYYVTQGGSGTACTGSSTPCSLGTALGQANVASGANTVHITGPFSLTGLGAGFTVGGALPGSSVSLVGSGSGASGTSLSGSVGLLYVSAGSSVSHLAVQSVSAAVSLGLGSSADDVVASATGPTAAAMTVSGLPATGDTTISHSVLSTPATDTLPALFTAGDATHRTIVSDSKITGGSGIGEFPGLAGVTKGVHVVRSVIDVTNVGMSATGSDSSITDSLIRVSGSGGQGVGVGQIFTGIAPHVDLLQDTIVGPGDATGSGVIVPPTVTPFMPGSATVTGSIVRGFADDLNVQTGAPGFLSGSATAALSDFEHPVSGPGNLAVDPGFADPASKDYRLTSGSPLIDVAGTAPANGETDIAGADRVADGNGDGTAARDMGAYEYPAVSPPTSPPAPPAGGASPKPRVASLKLALPHGVLSLGRGRLVLFNVGCSKRQSFGCRVTVTLRGVVHSSRSKTLRLGTGHALIAPGKHVKVRIRLTRRAAALIKAHKLRRVTAMVVGQDAAGAAAKPKRSYRIRYRARH
jgi:hypothetical protein